MAILVLPVACSVVSGWLPTLPANPQVVEVDGARLHYVERGRGEPLVLVHGTLQDYTFWLPHFEAFAHHFRAVTYSRRHNWPNKNNRPATDYSARQDARDLAALIEALDLGGVHLVGHSYGALAALMVAVEHPELVKTLVLGEPPVDDEPLDPAATPWLKNWPRYAAHVKNDEVRTALEAFVADVLGPEAAQEIPESVWAHLMLSAKEFCALVTSSEPFPCVGPEDLAELTMPMLLMIGQQNVGMAYENWADGLLLHLAGAESVTIPGASHDLWREKGPLAQDAVLGFLDRWATETR
jgi:pimeloyl-ACP methyl ester carboxylesterase